MIKPILSNFCQVNRRTFPRAPVVLDFRKGWDITITLAVLIKVLPILILMGYLTMDEPVTPPQPEDGKTLVAYFTWSNNTQAMAQTIAEQVNGDLLQIQPAVPYPTDYNECGAIARVERDENQRPAIANLPDDLSEYDTIFIGYPIWWHTAPMIIGTFLENYDLTGVDVYPFTQSASMDVGQFENSMEFVRESAAGANVHDGLFVRASDASGIRDYLAQNGFVR